MSSQQGHATSESSTFPALALREGHDASRDRDIRKSSFRNGAGGPERPSRRLHRGASTGAGGSALPGLQPVSAWHSPRRFAAGAIKGSTRSSNHLRSLFRRVASIDAAHSDGQPPTLQGTGYE